MWPGGCGLRSKPCSKSAISCDYNQTLHVCEQFKVREQVQAFNKISLDFSFLICKATVTQTRTAAEMPWMIYTKQAPGNGLEQLLIQPSGEALEHRMLPSDHVTAALARVNKVSLMFFEELCARAYKTIFDMYCQNDY